MLDRRLQVLIDRDRYARLEHEAARRRVSIAVVVRDAIDQALPVTDDDRRAAGKTILAAEQMPLPDWSVLKRELAETRSAWG